MNWELTNRFFIVTIELETPVWHYLFRAASDLYSDQLWYQLKVKILFDHAVREINNFKE